MGDNLQRVGQMIDHAENARIDPHQSANADSFALGKPQNTVRDARDKNDVKMDSRF
jgi:hypothetical protein